MGKEKKCVVGYLCLIALIFLIIGVSFIYITMPKKYCHNEYKTQVIKARCLTTLTGKPLTKNHEVICEEGAEVTDYGDLGKSIRIPCDFDRELTCIAREKVEVCEIR